MTKTKEVLKYTGPVSKRGIFLNGRLWPNPEKWNAETIKKNMDKAPELKKYFATEKTT